MKKPLVLLLFFAWFVASAYHYTCNVRGLCEECEETAKTEVQKEVITMLEPDRPSSPQFNIGAPNNPSYFSFAESPIITSGGKGINWPTWKTACVDSLYNFLNSNPNSIINLRGLYQIDLLHSDGISDSLLASQRLNSFKTDLTKYGINSDRILIDLLGAEKIYTPDNYIFNGLEIFLSELNKEQQEEIQAGIANKTLYCQFGAEEFNPDRGLKAYHLELKAYLDNCPACVVTLTGHTDDVGGDAPNYELGLKRAKMVKDFFRYEGIPEDKLKVRSAGEKEPVASNSTEKGRALNRRIQITIK